MLPSCVPKTGFSMMVTVAISGAMQALVGAAPHGKIVVAEFTHNPDFVDVHAFVTCMMDNLVRRGWLTFSETYDVLSAVTEDGNKAVCLEGTPF